jgi:hypothetical protein
MPGCEYRAKDRRSVKQHKAHIHALDIVWFSCDQPGCSFKAKQAGNLTKHKMVAHEINVSWIHCTVEGCDYKARFNYALKDHMKRHERNDKQQAEKERWVRGEGAGGSGGRASFFQVHGTPRNTHTHARAHPAGSWWRQRGA